ncbi:MAG: hypothetical protein ACYTFY_14570 [Planctomycetota bacterium]|jgi:hypothetical protein
MNILKTVSAILFFCASIGCTAEEAAKPAEQQKEETEKAERPAPPPPPAGAKVKINLDFEEWEWVPIPQGMGKALKKKMRSGSKPDMDIRGPMYRKFKGNWTGGPTGKMMEGEEAYEGKSAAFAKQGWQRNIGQHGPFLRFDPKGKFYYQVCLKGEGTFLFQGVMVTKSTAGGKTKIKTVPHLIKKPLTAEWQLVEGYFKFPEADAGYAIDYINCSIALHKDNQLSIDNFKIWEVPAGTAGK